jgi:hypothetical protein
MLDNIDEFLKLFPEKPRKKARKGFLVICPAHKDQDPSLWVKPSGNSDFTVSFDCQAGCSREAVLNALKLTWSDVIRRGNSKRLTGSSTSGKQRRPVDHSQKRNEKSSDDPIPAGGDSFEEGITLEKISEVKKLPTSFLKSLGITDCHYMGLPAVKIPYYSEDGHVVATRFRVALTGDRFRWRKGDHAFPYGLQILEEIRRLGWVLVVEGESDWWTGRFYNLPILGAPGKSNWPPEWIEYLKNIDVYVWQEPAAEDFVVRVLDCAPNLRYVIAPEGIKDISEAHIQGINVLEWLEELKAKAEFGKELKARAVSEKIKVAYEAALPVINSNDPLELVNEGIKAQGYGGDTKPVMITYLAMTSRLLEMRPGGMPVHELLKGPPSTGKSYVVKQASNLLPSEAIHVIDAGSPRTLIYDEAELQHRAVIFSEADSLPAGEDNPAASAIRNLLQDHFLHYAVTVRDPITGNFVVREVNKPGPTVLITTSIKSLGPQLMTRMFTIEVSDSEAQVKAALESQAILEIDGAKDPDATLIAFQQYLQLQAPFKVLVPFAKELATAVGKAASAPRVLRDFARLMSLIKSVTLLRYRGRVVNNNGQIVATIDDYRYVRDLVNDIYIDSSSGITQEVKEIVNKVNELNKSSKKVSRKINNMTLAKALQMTDKRVKRWAMKAEEGGWIINREKKDKLPADYIPGEPMPEIDGLPLAESLMPSYTDSTPSAESEAKNEGTDTSTVDTDGSAITMDETHQKKDSWQAVF